MISTAPGIASGAPTFDEVEVMDGTVGRSYSFDTLMALSLPVRIRLILAGKPRFLRGGEVIPKAEALSLAS